MNAPVVLVHPPQAKACEPPPGLLALQGHLRSRGIQAHLVDANLIVQEALLSADSLAACAEALAIRGFARARVTAARRAARRAPEAVAALRRPRAYDDPIVYRSALDSLVEAYRALSRVRGVRIGLANYEHPTLSPRSTADLTRAAREPETAGLAGELTQAAQAILAGEPGLIGVSLTYLSQALPTFALAGALRQAGYRGRLVLGGGLVSSWTPRLNARSEIFQVWDALVTGPGEGPLEDLARDRGAAASPGLLAPGLGIWRPNSGFAGPAPVCFDPDPSGLAWDRYLSPGPVLPLATSRGCYWRRCVFCPETAQNLRPFRSARATDLAQTILAARDAFGVEWFHLTDEAIPTPTLRHLAQALRGEGVRWYGFARPEPPLLDPSFAAELAAGGCAMLQLGVETASQRLLDLMGKGTRAAHAGAIVKNLAGAGIRTYVYLLFGIPTESEAEAEATLGWAADHADSITFLNLALLNMPRGSDLERNPARFGVTLGDAPADGDDLSLYHDPTDSGGQDRQQARANLTRAETVLREIRMRTPRGFTANHAPFAPLPKPFAPK